MRRPTGRSWARLSLRVRVTLAAALAVAVGLAVAATLLVLSLRAGLVGGLDDAAQARATDAATALQHGDLRAAVTTTGGDNTLVQVLAGEGSVLGASQGLTGRGPLVALPVAVGRRQVGNVSIGGRDFRALTQSVDGRSVVVVSPLADVQESTTGVISRILLGAPVLLAAICGAVWLLVGYTLTTVERLRGQVAELSMAGLDRRVDVPVARDEVRLLAVTMNDLLDRLQRAAEAQRRFVADAAHELRSPLTALRTRLEVNERAADPAGWQRAAPGLVSDTDRLASLLDDLLALARLDESPFVQRAVPVDLDDIVAAEVHRLRGASRVHLDTQAVSAGLVHGDPNLLTRIVANLLSNAVRHASTVVKVGVTTCDSQVELTVCDDGAGIPPADRERVFERFCRLDGARDRDRGGSGLGLAIVHEAVRAHHGAVTIQDARPGTLVTVWLPQDQ